MLFILQNLLTFKTINFQETINYSIYSSLKSYNIIHIIIILDYIKKFSHLILLFFNFNL